MIEETSDTPISRRDMLRGLAALMATAAVPPAFAQGALPAPQFASLSRSLTTFAYRDPKLAAAMLSALSSAIGAQTLVRIATIANRTPPNELDASLAAAGLQVAAQKVVVALNSGMVETPRGTVVLTYTDALVWQAVPWTKANGACGGVTDYWSSAPSDPSK